MPVFSAIKLAFRFADFEVIAAACSNLEIQARRHSARQAGTSQRSVSYYILACVRRKVRITRYCFGRSGVSMSKYEVRTPPAFGGASEIQGKRRGRSRSGRSPVMGDIGFIGLGRMGTAMAANLAASGRRVIAYVRRPDRIHQLEAIGLRPTTDIGDLLDCKVVISMLPDDDAVHEIVFGRGDTGVEGLAAGL